MESSGAFVATAQAVVTVAQVIAIVLLHRRPRRHRVAGLPGVVAAQLGCFGIAGAIVLAFGQDLTATIVVVLGATVLGTVVARRLHEFRLAGSTILTTMLLLVVLLLVGAVFFLLRTTVSAPTTITLWTAFVLYAVALPTALVKEFEGWEALMRVRWHRVGQLTRRVRSATAPMVSVHVPIHAEPPDVVMRTLDALARLDYPHYEVIVIDNNTTDEQLWRPIERSCAQLGLRFLHVEGITGAKAGALNLARPHVDPRATLMAVVDADYVADPRWLTYTVGYFDDPAVGFVQCPHAYRDHESASFTRMANAEYGEFFATEMMTLDEHGAGITVGTMSLVRLSALDAVGGWAEWCVTEDSELAIRIHAAGFSSVYVNRPYGWGLIPETFAGYKKQRFRWTYGPCQELAAHLRLYLPGRWGRRPPGSRGSALTVRQRLHHSNHGLEIILFGVKMLGSALLPVAMLSMLLHGESLDITAAFLATLVLLNLNLSYLRWFRYHVFQKATPREFLNGQLARCAITYTKTAAALRSFFGGSVRWERTDKFRKKFIRGNLLRSSGPETALAALFLLFGVIDLVAQPLSITSSLFAVALLRQAFIFATAPVLSYIADRDLRARTSAPDRATVLPTTQAEQQ